MNADASSDVDVRLSLGAKVSFVFWLGLGLVIGAAILVAGGRLIHFSVWRPAQISSAPTSAAA